MAKVASPIKVFNVAIEIDGLDVFEVQEVSIPEPEIEVTEHGDTNHNIGTAGKAKYGNIELKKLKRTNRADTWAWDWINSAQDPDTGGGGMPEDYKKTVIIKELAPNNVTTVNRWKAEGCFCIKVSQNGGNRMSSDNVIQTVTLWTDKVKPM